MPFRSLFSRKGSRKSNQSAKEPGNIKTESKQSNISEGTHAELGQSLSSRRSSEISHAECELQQSLRAKGKDRAVTKSAEDLTEVSFPPGVQTIDTREKELSGDDHSELKTVVESGVVQDQKDEQYVYNSQEEVNSPGKLNIHCETPPQNCNEPADEKERCPEGPSPPGSIDIPELQNGLSEPERGTKLFEQSDSGLKQCASNAEIDARKDIEVAIQEDGIGNNSHNLPQQQSHLDENSSALTVKQDDPDAKSDTKKPSESPESNNNSVTALSNEDDIETNVLESADLDVDFSAPNNNVKQCNANEPIVPPALSAELVKDTSTTVSEIHEPEVSGDVVYQTNYNNCTSSVSSTEGTTKNAQPEVNVCGNRMNEIDEKYIYMNTPSPEKQPVENEIIKDPSASDKIEPVADDCERIVDKIDSVDIVKTDDQNDLSSNKEHETLLGGEMKEIHDDDDDDDENNKTKNSERVSENVSESDIENNVDQNQTNPDDPTKTAEDGATSRPLNVGNAEHNIQEVPTSSQDVANNSPVTSDVDSIAEKTKIEADVKGSDHYPENSPSEECSDNKQKNTDDTNSRTEILESSPSLMETEGNTFNISHDSRSEVSAGEATTPLEDSLESFPSECDDFLGGQRKLMAAEQHPTHSWKVGYLQVKLPVKSRGRGKLKVWRQRWVVIQMDEFVKDAKDPSLMINIYASECGNARRHSALFWCSISASRTVLYRSQSRTHKYAFSLSSDNEVILHLAADSETASQEWMAAIRNLLWPPSPVLQLEKVLHGSDFEVSVIDNDFSFHAGLLGTYGNMKVTSNKLILSHPQTDHVIQEWYLNTLDKFQLLKQNKEEDAFKVVVMHTGQDSSTGNGQIILFCSDAVTMLQSIASTIHKLLQYRTAAGKDHNQQELADLADWLSPAMFQPSTGESAEDYYKVPRRQIRSLLDIPNFSFEKPLSTEGTAQGHETASSKPSMMTSSTSASTFSQDSGISMATQPDEYLNCSITSFTIGGRPVRDHTSSDSSDGYSPPYSPETPRKEQQTETT